MSSSSWYAKFGKLFEFAPLLGVGKGSSEKGHDEEERAFARADAKADAITEFDREEIFGVPRLLLPYYLSFMLDAIAVGLVMPLLPFSVMELGADALQLSLVVSSNYVAQSIGVLVMGKMSDLYGRRLVVTLCLTASSLSYFCLSRAETLIGVVLARLVSGSLGGLVPIMQSAVADVSSAEDRPKYIGRIMATFGLGFVLGPAISASLPHFTPKYKIMLASLLPFSGLLVMLAFGRETKREVKTLLPTPIVKSKSAKSLSSKIPVKESSPIPLEIMLLVLNGFLIMYAFATETIYAMFIKDSFGYGERALSTLFAFNGMFIGIFQIFLIKPLINIIGKHATLALGNMVLALGMLGVALVRERRMHFFLFAAHIVGYSIADTALASLVTKYSSPANQGRDLAFNQAAQSCARVISPLLAGILYELSKQSILLPTGALPFLAGAFCPAVAVVVPSLLYIRNVSVKRRPVAEGTSATKSKKCLVDSDDEES